MISEEVIATAQLINNKNKKPRKPRLLMTPVEKTESHKEAVRAYNRRMYHQRKKGYVSEKELFEGCTPEQIRWMTEDLPRYDTDKLVRKHGND